jgi:dipeptidyl aminopeptidase/acylaminoacyl peptidase
MNVDGSNVRRLTNDSASDLFPHWSPDGEWIVFSTNRDVDFEVYKMDKNGGQLMRITNDPAVDSNPAWSPDGTRIAFISRRDGFANLFVMNTDGGDVTQLTFYKSIVEVPSWSPDSRMIVFSSDMEGSREIYIIGADGNGLIRLTDSPSFDFYPDWSPQLSFLTSSLPEPTPAPGDICLISNDPDYGFNPLNPVRLGFDPRILGTSSQQCLPWLSGPEGQPLITELLEEVSLGDSKLCKVRVFYEGQEGEEILYFDTFNFEQPRAPVGFACGSSTEYIRMLANARYSGF